MKSWWQILPQHQSTHLRGPESASINPSFQTSLHKIFKNCFYVNLTSQHSHFEVLLLSKFWSERGISIDTDSGTLRYVLWCCGSICHQLFILIQIHSKHTVIWCIFAFYLAHLFELFIEVIKGERERSFKVCRIECVQICNSNLPSYYTEKTVKALYWFNTFQIKNSIHSAVAAIILK